MNFKELFRSDYVLLGDVQDINGNMICVKMSGDCAVVLSSLDDENNGYINSKTYIHYEEDYSDDCGEHEHVVMVYEGNILAPNALGNELFSPKTIGQIAKVVMNFNSYYNHVLGEYYGNV
jgi:hypothetical protein